MNEILYNNIKWLAVVKGTTISRIEKELGFSYSTISKWVKADPGLSRVSKVAEHLGVTIDTLYNVPMDSESTRTKLVADKFINLLIANKVKLELIEGVVYRAELDEYLFDYYEDTSKLILSNSVGTSRDLMINSNDDKTIKSIIHKQNKDDMLADALEFLSTID